MPGATADPSLADALGETLARIHAAAFAETGRAWSGPEILALATETTVSLHLAHAEDGAGALAPAGFALVRAAGGEAEVLTIAVAPEAQRQGLGRALLRAASDAAASAGAKRLFLEVGAGNVAARGLYGAEGFQECGRRAGYYQRPDGSREDALVLARDLP